MNAPEPGGLPLAGAAERPAPPAARHRLLAEWISDRANPILVRAVRQELRNKAFIGIFIVLLVVAAISAVVTAGIAGSEDRNPQAGRGLFGVLAWAWSFVVVVQSIGTFRAVVLERNEDTWDLVDLTGMGPRRILRGLLMANLVQAQLYAAALAPFLAMAYLLRGLDLFSIAFALVIVPLAGVAGSTCAVMLASLGTNKASRGFLGGVLGLGLIVVWLMTFSFWFNTWGGGLEGLIEEIRRGGSDAWLGLGLAFNCWLAFVVAMLVFAGALMAHRAADRSSGPRLLWLLLWLDALAWFVGFGWWDGMARGLDQQIGEMLAGFAIFGVLWAVALGVFSVTEEFELSPRQARAITQAGGWRRRATLLLGPGAARGRLAFLLLTAASLVLGWCGTLLDRRDGAQQTVNAALVLACHGCFLLMAGDWLCRRWFASWIDTPVLRRGFILVLAACWCLVPVLAALVVNAQRLDQSLLAAVSPVMAVAAVYDSGSNSRLELALAFAGVVGVASTAILLVQGLRLRIATRRIAARDNDANPRGG
jgi:hypothetical protein